MSQEDLLVEKCPEWALLKSHASVGVPLLSGKLRPWNRAEIEILYIYGLSKEFYQEINGWLHENPHRQCVVFEDSMDRVASLSHESALAPALLDKQVTIRLILGRSLWDTAIDRALDDFPYSQIGVTAPLDIPHQAIRGLKSRILRKAGLFQAIASEVTHYPKLVRNLYANTRKLLSSFNAGDLKGKFKGIPAVVCGAGPSLESEAALLKTMENRALIIAGGSALSALHRLGVRPHFGMAVDPNPEEFIRLSPIVGTEVPLLYAGRVCPEVFPLFNGPTGFFSSHTGGPYETWIEEQLGIDNSDAIGRDLASGALSVTTLALAMAVYLGCSPVFLTGIDLAFSEGKKYASGVKVDPSEPVATGALDQLVRKKDKEGKKIITQTRWVIEAQVIGDYAKLHPDSKIIDCTNKGIPIPGAPHLDLKTAAQQYCKESYNLRGLVMRAIQDLPLIVSSKEKLKEMDEKMTQSLSRCRDQCTKALKEPYAASFCEFELRGELAYRCLFETGMEFFSHLFPEKPLVKWSWMDKGLSSLEAVQFGRN